LKSGLYKGIYWNKQPGTIELQVFLIDIFKVVHFWAQMS